MLYLFWKTDGSVSSDEAHIEFLSKLQIQRSKVQIISRGGCTQRFNTQLFCRYFTLQIWDGGGKKKDPVETTTESVSLLLRVVPKVLQLCMTAAGARGLQTVISIRVQPTEDLLTY